MNIKKHIPNALTCSSLLCGCFSILFIASGMPIKASVMILVAGLFDYLDGFAARLLDAHSPIGPDLDSLADVVSFGVAPGLIMSYMMNNGLDMPQLKIYDVDLMPCFGFLLPVFAAIRLARFNIDETQKTSFRGMSAPAMAIFVASLPLALAQVGHLLDGALGYWACLGITLLLSFMMVSNLRCFSFKMKSLGWKGNEVRWIFLLIAVVGFLIFRWLALPFIMIIYILMSVFFARKPAEE
ncbi:MAG: CDP-alcohol phosphatidyltransferase family protein [Bacteroidales bacterium]|nr:CDP-alcohol phosphatidyltransferase family protein [Bacteroidales bacterium]